MTTILIVEDDDAIRNNIVRLLKLEGFDTLSASDGSIGLQHAKAFKPVLIISDVSMPVMNGFELLAAVRADKALATLPFILLTALDDRNNMRRGMAGGADDYLSKPFTRTELLDAVNAQMRKRGLAEEALQSRLTASEEHLRAAFADRIGGGLAQTFTPGLPEGNVTEKLQNATVLFSDIRDFTSLAEKLTSSEVAELLTKYFEDACQPILKNGGGHLKFIGNSLVAVFTDTATSSPLPSARRAISAALAMTLAGHEFRGWLQQRFPARGLPAFAIGVGLHCGEVTLCQLSTVPNKEVTPIGEAVNTAAHLETATRALGWSVVASAAVLAPAGQGIQLGMRSPIGMRGKELLIDALEITGLVTSMEDKIHGMASLTERALEIREAVKINSDITARAVKNALDAKLSSLNAQSFDPAAVTVRLKGYRITRKIGTGGMTKVYLAERESDGLNIVLKILDSHGKNASEHLVRFIQEYALLSQITHPHVIRIYDQGFTDDHAYIAMEYFERGDLRTLFGPEMTQKRVLAVIREVAGALGAIHEKGIVHRDIKPENIMRRVDGSVALADFGIAKSMFQEEGMEMTQTHHGDVVGTPYYLSPEQASGKVITTQSDLYSLGVMMFEMLTGRRPFVADSLDMLLAQHVHAETPALLPECAFLQPIVNKLMCKDLVSRYASAQHLLTDMDQLELKNGQDK